jgi:hypothetical protein
VDQSAGFRAELQADECEIPTDLPGHEILDGGYRRRFQDPADTDFGQAGAEWLAGSPVRIDDQNRRHPQGRGRDVAKR